MSAMVDVWVDELSKIRDKVRARKPAFFLLRGKRRQSMASVEDEENKQEGNKSQSQDNPSSTTVLNSPAVKKNETTLSESTVCLLMDRFAPC